MNERVKRLKSSLKSGKFPLCVEKAKLILESYERNAGRPLIIQRAQATADYLDNRTLFIEDDELLIGNIASKPGGMEVGSQGPGWIDEDLDDILAGGAITISDEDRKILRSMDAYWEGKGRTLDERQGSYYDDKRLWPFIKKGFLCPPWQSKTAGRGQGSAGNGWGLGMGPMTLIVPDFEAFIYGGVGKLIKEAEEKLDSIVYDSAESVKRADFYKAVLIAFPAVIRLSHRFADLAEKMAGKEKDETRRKELLQIAETCRWVPENPARTFREGIQSFLFYWLLTASGTTPGGRFDQYMYPLYKGDIEAGRITDEEVLELLECLRIKIMQMNFIGGGKGQREKWAGMARWHNFVIGGCDSTGKDQCNELTMLLMDAAMDCQTPHPTLTLRVNDQTPDKVMEKALKLVRTGCGMPAFISEDNYISFLLECGVDLESARDFAIAGCLDTQLPGDSRNNAFGMFIVPMVLEIAMNQGRDPKTGQLYGVETKPFAEFESYEEFYEAFEKQLNCIIGMVTEEHNILLTAQRDLFPDVIHGALLKGGMEAGRDGLQRRLKFENSSVVNCVGMVNVANSLAAVKKLIFEEKSVTAEKLMYALNNNWEGCEDIREKCLKAPKFGNNDPYVDDLAAELWQSYIKLVRQYKNIFGTPVLPTAISITAHAPGGALTGATPDGRLAGETFADGSISPVQGTDRNGPTSVFLSGMKVPQEHLMATLMNMKFHVGALKTQEDLKKLGSLIRTYLKNGGKHVQFNVVDQETLIKAKEDKEAYSDLIVRVAGYSAYFTTLTSKVQDEIIKRTGHECC